MTTIKDQAIEEILSFIQEQQHVDEDGFTARELMKSSGWGENKVSRTIDDLIEKELLECVRLTRINRAGIQTRLVGYRLTAKAQDKAAAQS